MEALLVSRKGLVTHMHAHSLSCGKDKYALATEVSNLPQSCSIKHLLASYNPRHQMKKSEKQSKKTSEINKQDIMRLTEKYG